MEASGVGEATDGKTVHIKQAEQKMPEGKKYNVRGRTDPRKSEDIRESKEKRNGKSAKCDKDAISWLNKKITKQDEDASGTKFIRTKKSAGKRQSQTQMNRKPGSDRAGNNWRDRDVGRDSKGIRDVSNQFIQGQQQRWRTSERDGQLCNPDSGHADNVIETKQFGGDSKTRRTKNPQTVKGSTNYRNKAEQGPQRNGTHKFNFEDAAEGGCDNENDTSRHRFPEQSDNSRTDSNYLQYNDVQPQVYVYGGLHVYNMPYVDQQYYGQQWYNYAGEYQNWNPAFQQHNQNKTNFTESKYKDKINSYPKKSKDAQNNVNVDPNHSVQASALSEQLMNESYECMVCCEKIRCQAPVWNCTNCYHVFHLRCVKKWASSPAALVQGECEGWRCPACQNINQLVPKVYQCFCGKVIDPIWNPREGIMPHSCGELCQKKRETSECPHLCNQLCHPGPCPSCPVMVSKSCMCGKMTQQTRCGNATLIQCKEKCGKPLNCFLHPCELLCHQGNCDSCEVDKEQLCYCGKSTRKTKCGTGEFNEIKGRKGYFSCGNICKSDLDCGIHKCARKCHKGDCESCNLTPSRVTHCPCGKTSLDRLLKTSEQRKSCMDPIPTCDKICNKVLPCSPTTGDASLLHRCKQVCHHGDCGPCDGKTTLICGCGSTSKEIDCCNFQSEAFLCDQRCNKKRQCGRHRCNRKCCTDKEHKCELVCGKKLRCGTHYCDESCHRGYCPPCLMTGFEEVTCNCGSTIMYPPIPCGTPPPECTKPCSRSHSCSHPVNHMCHSEEICPPCTVLTKKMCNGNHQLRLNVPCHVTDVSCGKACGLNLNCGHKCIKPCHKPPCDSEPCAQPCKENRKECGHVCGAPCHYGKSCPDDPCQTKITISCKCGRRSEVVPCLQCGDKTVLAQFYQRMTTESLANKMKDVQLGQSVDISTVIMLDDKSTRYIECNDRCAHSERARRMAEALGVDPNAEPFGGQHMVYSPFLLNEAKSNLAFIKTIEQAFENLVTVAQKLPSGQKSHSFPPMNSNQRRIIHELSVHYICSSVSYDAEPKRNTVITATKSSRLPPYSLSSQIERERNPPAPPPVPYVPTNTVSKFRTTRESKTQEKAKQWTQVPDYFADDFND